MNSNRSRFVLLQGAEGLRVRGEGLAFDAASGMLMLARRDQPRLPRLRPTAFAERLARAAVLVQDDHGQLARLHALGHRIECDASGSGRHWQPLRAERDSADGPAPSQAGVALDPVDAPMGCRFADLALGGSGLLAAPFSDGNAQHGVVLVHLRRRWQQRVALPQPAWRVWVDAADRVWLLAAGLGAGGSAALGAGLLMHVRGAPLPQPYRAEAGRFEPEPINPDPPRLLWQQPLPLHGALLAFGGGTGRLFLLARDTAAGAVPRMAVFSRSLADDPGAPWRRQALAGTVPLATDLCALSDEQLLLLQPLKDGRGGGVSSENERDLALVELPPGAARGSLLPVRWPRPLDSVPAFEGATPPAGPPDDRDFGARFVRHRDGQPRGLTASGVRRLWPLAQARFVAAGHGVLEAVLDAGSPDTHWDRLYLEARLPPGCTLRVAAWAGEVPEPPASQAGAGGGAAAGPGLELPWLTQPALLKSPLASELPFADAAGPADAGGAAGTAVVTEAAAAAADAATTGGGRVALWELQLQRPGGAVRALRGRFLRIALRFAGDGRHSPALRALRAWFPRYSWQERYLPEHMRQQAPVDTRAAALTEDANGADLRERVLAAFESAWTPLEDRIGAAEMLLDPDAAPAAFLPTLGRLLGTRWPAAWPVTRQRRWLAGAGQRQRTHGSMAALVQALDIVCDGAVRRGQVIPVEHFRLRRTLATVLGIDMDDSRHPLTLGTGLSGNSRVGDTLILAEDDAAEFLALFAPELARTPREQAVVREVFASVARRMTVILHGPARAYARAIAEALPTLVPATVQWAVRESERPFVLGLSPLLGIDTYLEPEPPPRPLVLDRSVLAGGDLLRNPVALVPDEAGPQLAAPAR